jgi:hypothetical protein
LPDLNTPSSFTRACPLNRTSALLKITPPDKPQRTITLVRRAKVIQPLSRRIMVGLKFSELGHRIEFTKFKNFKGISTSFLYFKEIQEGIYNNYFVKTS